MTTMQFAPPGPRTAGRVLAHLDALTVTQRQVFVLHGASGLSLGETARRTGLARTQVRSIFRGAAQRLADATATPEVSGDALTPAPEVFRGSPENSPDRANNPPEQGLCAPAQESPCPPWCRGCDLEADGVRYHLSHGEVLDYDEGVQPELCFSRLDEDGEPGPAMIELCLGLTASASITPTQALALAARLRDFALTAAAETGTTVPVEQVRIGEEIETAAGWQPVESLLIDGTAAHVAVYTSDGDDTGHAFTTGDLVRVRKAVTE